MAILIFKLLHVLFIFIWVGSLLTLTRLLAYVAKEPVPIQERMMKILKRAYLFADLPAMILAVALGLTLLFLKEMDWKAPWLHMKLTFAALLIICDIICGYHIVRHSHIPITGKGTGYKVLHILAGLIFLAILIAIYILKTCLC